jgi:hypothetical protein
MTFRLTMHDERRRWLRDQRAQLYIDMLVELQARESWDALGDRVEALRKVDVDVPLTDDRLPHKEFGILLARGGAFASEPVMEAFMRCVEPPELGGLPVADSWEEFVEVIRQELLAS